MSKVDPKLGEAFVEVHADLDRLDRDLDRGKRETKKATSAMSKSFAGMKKGIGVAVGALGGLIAGYATLQGAKALSGAIKNTLSFVDAIDKQSRQLGVSAEFFQKVEFAASQSGISIEEVAMSMRFIAKNAALAGEGNKTVSDAFDRLGVSVHDANGQLKQTEQIYTETINALPKIANSTERIGLTMKVLGARSVSVLNMADAFNDLTMEAERLGLVIDNTLVEQGVNATDTLDVLSRVTRAELSAALLDLSPMLIRVGEGMVFLARGAAEAWARLADYLNLDPTTLKQSMDRHVEVLQEIAEKESLILKFQRDLITEHNRSRRRMFLTAEKDTMDEIITLMGEQAALEEKIAKLTERTAAATVEIEKPDIAVLRDATNAWDELDKKRRKAAAGWGREAENMATAWDRAADNASSSMARMVADGEISFAELGKAFVQNFTEYVIESLVMSRLFGMLGSFVGSFSQTPVMGPGGNTLYPGGGVLAPDIIPQIPFAPSGLPPSLPGGASVSRPASVTIINQSGSPTSESTDMDGSVRVFIGSQSAEDVYNGGDLAQAIEKKYGLRPDPVRRG